MTGEPADFVPVYMKPPRSAYVHVPFCAHRCGYCDFSVIADRLDLVERYLDAARIELNRITQSVELDTLYLGGGTPTQLGADGLIRLFAMLDERLPRAQGAECTVELNPEDMTAAIQRALEQCNVTRLSIGVQSFHEDKLKALDRQHSVGDTYRAIELAREFESFSIDLMFAAAEETLDRWKSDLETAIAQKPDHISTYCLTIEPGTPFHSAYARKEMEELGEDTQLQMYEWTIERLQRAGFGHYEVSNFAQPGHRSRHNEIYWTGRSYFGIGPGAASFIDGVRRTNHRSVVRFLDQTTAGEVAVMETVQEDREALARELLVFGLRRIDGIDSEVFRRNTGFDLIELGGEALDGFLQDGLMQWQGSRLSLTRKGLPISDSLLPALI